MHYSDLQDILVLGSSRGLGKSLYKLFQSDGFKVIGVSRSKSNQSDFICDLSNKHEVKNLVDTFYNSGNIAKNIIFNAGQGSSSKKSIKERKEELMQQNLHTSRNFVEELKKIPKILEIVESFTFINSICALKNFKCSDEYEQSKFELLKYSRDLAEDFVRYRIRVNSILPGILCMKTQFGVKNLKMKWKKIFSLRKRCQVETGYTLNMFLVLLST